MLKVIAAVLGGGVVGGAIGFAAGIFVYPYIFLADIVASEEVQGAETKQAVATGTFVHANPADPIHYGRGGLTLYDDLLHLESDFEVGPGPKFHVYLVPSDKVTSAADVEGTMFVDLGRLKAFKGSQNYPVPAGVNLSNYGSVVIWCEQFGVLISPARLAFHT
ncbi:MAG TPA: DM13 domain-containing protein [Kiloniellales bacterium]